MAIINEVLQFTTDKVSDSVSDQRAKWIAINDPDGIYSSNGIRMGGPAIDPPFFYGINGIGVKTQSQQELTTQKKNNSLAVTTGVKRNDSLTSSATNQKLTEWKTEHPNDSVQKTPEVLGYIQQSIPTPATGSVAATTPVKTEVIPTTATNAAAATAIKENVAVSDNAKSICSKQLYSYCATCETLSGWNVGADTDIATIDLTSALGDSINTGDVSSLTSLMVCPKLREQWGPQLVSLASGFASSGNIDMFDASSAVLKGLSKGSQTSMLSKVGGGMLKTAANATTYSNALNKLGVAPRSVVSELIPGGNTSVFSTNKLSSLGLTDNGGKNSMLSVLGKADTSLKNASKFASALSDPSKALKIASNKMGIGSKIL